MNRFLWLTKKRRCIVHYDTPSFLYIHLLCLRRIYPQPVIKIFRFDIEQIVMERAYNKIRCMQQ